jgi:Ca2+-binding EF-hand superfamily protein
MLAPPRSKVQDNIGLSISEEMKALAKTHKERRHRSKKKKKIKVNYAELLNIKVLKNIRREFVQKGGKHESLTADDFIDVLSEYINRSDVEAIYKKIDVNDDGMVDWEEFTGFLNLLKEEERQTLVQEMLYSNLCFRESKSSRRMVLSSIQI